MDRQPTLETERLVLRPLTDEDHEALYEIASDPMVWEQHPIHDRWRREVFDAFFDEALASGGALAVVETAKDRIVGSTRYDKYDPEDDGVVEIGWTFLERRCWGKGINPEMKRAMLAHAFEHVALVEFRVGDTNYRSRNALEAIGATRTDRYELERYQGKRVVHLVYEISRERFEAGLPI
ncbi:GNAT family N-acetyltransferase [Qipengyuania sp. XHP0207]|uniref:GNAT family N-acetyltransferase n=1 Tax=Qipengyuania sp. XHP0207 TaxID=3038078 RepID=UPI00241F5D29|nr:GNAT family N-acetyltransferase [Qipengyuania sp. XHP0207]MDG5746781.1 GNAT family N-acetyltransferase [Qipengyuania sp. XHP0207]